MLCIRITLAIFYLLFLVASVAAQPKPPENISAYKQDSDFSGAYTVQVSDIEVLERILENLVYLHPKPDTRASIKIRGNIRKKFEYRIKIEIEKDHEPIGETKMRMIPCGVINRAQATFYAVGTMKLKGFSLPASTLFEITYDKHGRTSLEYWVKSWPGVVLVAQAVISRLDSFQGETVQSLIGQEFKRGLDKLQQRVAEISSSQTPATNSK